jgi:hypothetical protein
VEEEQKSAEQGGEEREEEMEVEEAVREGDGGEGERVEQLQEQGGKEKERELEGEVEERKEEMKEEEEREKVERGEGEKMELGEDTPAHTVEEANQEKVENQLLRPKEDGGVREDQASEPPPAPLIGATRDQPRPLMEERPAEPRPLAPPTSGNKPPRLLTEAAPTQPRPLMETVVEKPPPLMSTKPPQVTSDYHSASDTPRQEEMVAMATVNHTGPAASSNDKSSAASVADGPKEVGTTKHSNNKNSSLNSCWLLSRCPHFRKGRERRKRSVVAVAMTNQLLGLRHSQPQRPKTRSK